MKPEELNWSKVRAYFASPEARDCVTVVAQDADDGRVLMVGHATLEAVRHMIATRQFALWSTSRRDLWIKGGTSGNTFEVVEIRADCDGDAILVRVRGRGPMCHTGARDCFIEPLAPEDSAPQAD